jgi:Zn-dependent protease with chaperone function
MTLALCFLVSLIPGAMTWWWGRALPAYINDPALPERLLAFRQRRSKRSFPAILVACLLGGNLSPLFILVNIFSVVACSFPSRRTLFSEKWGFFSHLYFQIRLIVAFGGFWFALLLTPYILLSARRFWLPAAIMLVLLLALWVPCYRNFICALFHTSPLARPDLESLFAEIDARAFAHPRGVYKAGLNGGVWVNALVAPSVFGSAVVISDTLLETFEPQEIAAVYAHEVAHIEHYSKKARLLRGLLASWSSQRPPFPINP